MAFTAQNIIDDALVLLEDTEQNRFTDEMLLGFINECIIDLVRVAPSSSVAYSTKTLAAGAMQTLTGAQLYLLDVLYNTNVGNTLQGRTPIRVKKATLDFSNPTWMLSTQKADVQFYTYDSEDTRVFFVYPPNLGTGYLRIKTADIPSPMVIGGLTANVPYDDEFRLAVVYYVCMKAYMVDTDTINTDKVALYKGMYEGVLGVLEKSDTKEDTKNVA